LNRHPKVVGIRGEWSQDGDNNNFIDHLQKGQSLVCIKEFEVVVDAASTSELKSAGSS
tara:strand:+ start:179 stop:352 length:174 start_codon:yes stop_codon:yes gene_type:complete